MKTQLLLIICFITGTLSAQEYTRSSSQNGVKTSGDVLFIAAPLTCLAVTVYKQDWEGLKQGALSGATSLAITYTLKYSVRKTRPDGSDRHSFPSAHTAVSFTGAAFLQQRYGWTWGAPAYLLAGYVGWSRTYAKKHDWWDVIAGAAIGTGSAYLFTRPFAQKHNLAISPIATPSHMGLHLSMNF